MITTGDYDSDPTAGSHLCAPDGYALGPQADRLTLPEDSMTDDTPFDFANPAVVRDFETSVIRSQVPGYDLMRLRCLQVAVRFLRADKRVLDLGTSRGKMIRDLVQYTGQSHTGDLLDRVRYVGVDLVQEMLDSARSDIDGLYVSLGRSIEQADQRVELIRHDLNKGAAGLSGAGSCSLVTAILTLQFVSTSERQQVVKDAYDLLAPGGAFILVEKTTADGWMMQDLLDSLHQDEKRRNGVSEQAITNKIRTIAGYLSPQRSEENHHMLAQAGFNPYQTVVFWRDLSFEAIVAVR